MDEASLMEVFSEYGAILDLTVIRDRATNLHKGCAFVIYTSRASAMSAVANLHERVKLRNVSEAIVIPIM